MSLTIALDAMGGDHGISVVAAAALDVLKEYPSIRLILVGDRDRITEHLRSVGATLGDRLRIQHASQQVEMDESPVLALKNKKDSSMRVAMNLVKSGEANACVSAGNSGALMAIARFVLKTLPGIDRPAMMAPMPTIHGQCHMLDLGANVEVSPEVLFQFAVMGSALVSAIENKAEPTVGLLNIGEEDIKGNESIKKAAQLLTGSALNYHGFIEGNDIFKGKVDVVVCDGLLGNIALKSSEGVARMITHFLRQSFTGSWYGKLIGLLAKPVFKTFRRRIDPACYNGATLVGLQGIVVKSHGGAEVAAFTNAIKVAIKEASENVPERIASQLQTLLVERRAV